MTTVHCLPIAVERRAPALASAITALSAAVSTPYVAVTKGAVDGMLDVISHVWEGGSAQPLTDERRAAILAANERMARNGMRVLAVAFRPVDTADGIREIERGLTYIGLSGMIDPPRPEVRAAVATCRAAGIRPVIITGDHPLTASYIARDLGIASDDTVVTGVELSAMNEAELAHAARTSSVYARVSPEHKLRIVEALRAQGQVVAMTGDGVNDAPALKKADIGVAMGITGTDVSKEASDMALRDDNFATIVAAVEEGRVIYDNLRRFVKFVVAGNIGKVLVMLLWPALLLLAGRPVAEAVALLPLQLLWLNLMTDGLLGLGMGVEPAEKHVMQRPPHSPRAGIFSGGMGVQVAWTGVAIAAMPLGVGLWYYLADSAGPWQTMMFATLAFLQIFQALATRSTTESLFTIGLTSNRVLLGIVAAVTALQLAALYTPLGAFLGVATLGAADLLVAVGAGLLLFAAAEVEKVFLRRREARPVRDAA